MFTNSVGEFREKWMHMDHAHRFCFSIGLNWEGKCGDMGTWTFLRSVTSANLLIFKI